MKIIGITGGIGAGKSTVTKYLESKGFTVIDADKIAHDIYKGNESLLEKIKENFGRDLVDKEGNLNRRELAVRAFETKEKKLLLEELTHREILKRIEDEVNEADKLKAKEVFIDAILLFESGLSNGCDEVWVVDAPMEERIKRVSKRDDMTEDEIALRIKMQMSSFEMRSKATRVLDNKGEIETLYTQIDNLLETF
ncbi:MAG: dephospho-CoA kinase [Anaerovoracaceae bacterium]|nr:dephospho-CoA kinase [Clostridiales bacterium]